MVKTGLEIFAENHISSKARLGLLANQASIGPNYRHAREIIDSAFPGQLKTLLGPQHGFNGEKQDNMIETGHTVDEHNRPVYSLYGETRRPTSNMLANLDILLIDLFDIGTRVYTFAQTMTYCLEEAAKINLEVIILDRPNPIGGLAVEGNPLQDNCKSFVGLYPVPMRHGFTMGELAGYINSQLTKPARLKVIKVQGWQRDMYFNETGLPWVYPSPNMPEPLTAWLYPGQVLWEGTNISEGRGTTKPFHLCGAPFINPKTMAEFLTKLDLPGVIFRPVVFEPTFHKWAFQECGGLEIHPVNKNFKPYLTSLAILEGILKFWPEDFKLKEPPYEYEFHRRPLDLILGDDQIFDNLQKGCSAISLEAEWQPALNNFFTTRNNFLLYE